MTRYAILKIESFEGSDTFVRCGTVDQDYIYAVLAIDNAGSAEIIDSGYLTHSDAIAAWPEATLGKETSSA